MGINTSILKKELRCDLTWWAANCTWKYYFNKLCQTVACDNLLKEIYVQSEEYKALEYATIP